MQGSAATGQRAHRTLGWWIVRVFWVSFLAFQIVLTALAGIAQLDVILGLIFLPNPEDRDGIIIIWPIAGWIFAQVILSPITALAAIAMASQMKPVRR